MNTDYCLKRLCFWCCASPKDAITNNSVLFAQRLQRIQNQQQIFNANINLLTK